MLLKSRCKIPLECISINPLAISMAIWYLLFHKKLALPFCFHNLSKYFQRDLFAAYSMKIQTPSLLSAVQKNLIINGEFMWESVWISCWKWIISESSSFNEVFGLQLTLMFLIRLNKPLHSFPLPKFLKNQVFKWNSLHMIWFFVSIYIGGLFFLVEKRYGLVVWYFS